MARPLVTLTLLSICAHHAHARAQTCEIEGRVDSAVRVEALEGSVVLEDVPVILRVTEAETTHVEVRGALQFDAHALADGFSYRLQRRVTSGHGMLSLAPGESLKDLVADANGVRATATLGAVEVTGLDIPCDALTIAARSSIEADDAPQAPQGDGTYWTSSGGRVRIRPSPDSPDSILVRVSADGMWQRIQARGRFTQVFWTHDRTLIVGWVQSASLREPGASEDFQNYATLTGLGVSGWRPAPGARSGPAVLRRGAPVRSAEEGQVWASVASGEPFTVEQQEGATWTRILVVPGMRSEASAAMPSAWIRSRDVRFVD